MVAAEVLASGPEVRGAVVLKQEVMAARVILALAAEAGAHRMWHSLPLILHQEQVGVSGMKTQLVRLVQVAVWEINQPQQLDVQVEVEADLIQTVVTAVGELVVRLVLEVRGVLEEPPKLGRTVRDELPVQQEHRRVHQVMVLMATILLLQELVVQVGQQEELLATQEQQALALILVVEVAVTQGVHPAEQVVLPAQVGEGVMLPHVLRVKVAKARSSSPGLPLTSRRHAALQACRALVEQIRSAPTLRSVQTPLR